MSTLAAAILRINPNAEVSFTNDDINTIIWHEGTDPISVADIQEQITIVEQEIADAKAARIAKKKSGNDKLLALGLDAEEIKAIMGR
jgi:uncharacterized small protein (DUF1192 family)